MSNVTKNETARTVVLFVRAYGDKPIKEITGGVAGMFRDLLFTLPTSYAKGKQKMDLNAEVERVQELDLPTLSGKSVKNHFMRRPLEPAYPPRDCGQEPVEQLGL